MLEGLPRSLLSSQVILLTVLFGGAAMGVRGGGV
jgi:hypothetical protein